MRTFFIVRPVDLRNPPDMNVIYVYNELYRWWVVRIRPTVSSYSHVMNDIFLRIGECEGRDSQFPESIILPQALVAPVINCEAHGRSEDLLLFWSAVFNWFKSIIDVNKLHNHFRYLDSEVMSTGRLDEELKIRIARAPAAFGQLFKVCKSTVSLKTTHLECSHNIRVCCMAQKHRRLLTWKKKKTRSFR